MIRRPGGFPAVRFSSSPASPSIMQQKHQYGGQAVIEGVMIRGRAQAALAVRNQAGEICLRSVGIPGWSSGLARRIPYLRGVLVFAEMLVVGMRSLAMSAAIAADEGEGEEEASISGLGIAVMIAISLALGIGLFFVAPFFLSGLIESSSLPSVVANLIEGIIRLGILVGYVWLIGHMEEIKRVLAYHGAEHMAVSAHEAGDPLTTEGVRRHSTAHPRCGTAFLLTVVLIAVVAFLFVPRDPIPLVAASRIVLVPVIAAISYEFIRFTGRHPGHRLVHWLAVPNLWLQRLTTRQPDDEHIQVAIGALTHAMRLDGDEASEELASATASREEAPIQD